MRRVGVFATLSHIDPGYSLCAVILQQLEGLKRYGYDPVLIALPSLKDDVGVPVRHVPQLLLEPYRDGGCAATFEEDTLRVADALHEAVKDLDVVICHDIHFQEWFVPYNKAVRIVAERLPKLRWLHFTHSAPSPWQQMEYPHSLRYEMMPNGKLVYLNYTDHIRCVEMYKGAELSDVVVIPNPMDAAHFLGTVVDVPPRDVVVAYPFSATRMGAKGVQKVIRLLAEMKKLSRSVYFVAIAAHANGEREQQAITSMRLFARGVGLVDGDMYWTSDTHPHGVAPHVVREYFQLSNVFMLPSDSENCSLSILEAALTKNLCVLNKSFRPMADQLGIHALYFDFGALGNAVQYADANRWYREVALLILHELENNKALQAARVVRQNHSVAAMMEKHLMPVIESL